MANQEHLDMLKQGVDTWNRWREEHPEIQPDLSKADLSVNFFVQANLSSTNLFGTNLSVSNCIMANFSKANLSKAKLTMTHFNGTDLSDANLTEADLRMADLSEANLSRVDFYGAIVSDVSFYGADLNGANLGGARIGFATFGNVDLSTVKGLDAVIHVSPSTLGIDTIYRSTGKIPEIFLRKAGVPDSMIEYIQSLVGKPNDYYTCFISYSSKDQDFVERLYADLQGKGIRCWYAPEDLKIGEKIRTGIYEAIRLHDKLLLVLSKSSVASGWVEHEVKNARAKERKEKRTVLFPVCLDKAIFDSPLSWATEIRHERNIGDFTRWKTHDEYQKAFKRLLRDLKTETQ